MKNNLHKLINGIVNWPKALLFCNLVVVFILSSGLPQLSVSNDFRVYFSEDNPQLKAFENFEDNYVKSDSATLVISAREGELFTNDGIELIKALTAEAWQIPYAYRVSSLANYQYTRSSDDEITTSDLFDVSLDDSLDDVTNAQRSKEQLQQIRTIALSEKRLVNSLLTKDGKLSVIVTNLGFMDKTRDHSQEITEYVEALRDRYRLQYPNFNIDSGGSTAFNTTLARAVKQDMSTLIPLSYLLIFVGLFYFIRSFLAAAAIFVLISLCLISTFGFFGWITPILTPMAGFAPSILLSIMVADSVHILITFLKQLQQGDAKPLAVQ
ncbi:MAG: MMPL family transporter, partial [Gammaproteobacteria bacterium]|nr:MMPL family transporter [Gammaproteobacteria bacterium]